VEAFGSTAGKSNPLMRKRSTINGWAQIDGRNAIVRKQKFEVDPWYVDHWSFWLDTKIVWLPAKRRPKDIISKGHFAMPEF